MTMIKPAARIALMGLCLAASAFASAQEAADTMQRPFSAPVTVSATGKATIGELSGVQGQLAEAVRSQLVVLQYVPARRDGVAVDRATHVAGSAVLTPLPDGTFDMRLQGVTLAPKLAALNPPRYPSGQMRHGKDGSVEVAVLVGADGRIKGTRTIASSGGDFEKAVRQAMRQWRFEPNAGAEDVEVTIPVWFYVGDNAGLPQFQCELDPRRAHVAGQSGCLDRLEITGWPVGRDMLIPASVPRR